MFKFNIFGNIIFKKAFIITSKEGNAMNKKTMYNLTYGLFVLTSAYEGKDSGCIINTAGQVTSEPNRISITVNKANFTMTWYGTAGNLTFPFSARKPVLMFINISDFSPAVRLTNLPVMKVVNAAPMVCTILRQEQTVISVRM